jgi:hypothetical protein
VHVGTEVPRTIRRWKPLIVTDVQKADDASLTLLMGRLKKGRFVIDGCSHRQGARSEGEVAPVGITDGGMEVALPVRVGVRVGAARG